MSDLLIETQGLRYRFGHQLAVRDLDLAVPARSIYGFIGPNGAGKSTTIKLLLGLLQPAAGSVTLFGQSLAGHRCNILARVGALIESPSLYGNLTARENLRWLDHLFGLGRQRIDEVLELVDLQRVADKKVRKFSMGMKQRLGIAMALFHDPDLVVLDEPVNGLDPAGIQEMRQLFQRLRDAGKTLLISSHLLDEVERIATHVGIIRQGRLCFQGAIGELRAGRQPQVLIRTTDASTALGVLRDNGMAATLLADGRIKAAATEGPAFHRLLTMLIGAGVEIHHAEVAGGTLEEHFFQLTESTISL